MQDFSQHQQFSEQEKLKCPRCESTNTKFCYYNNYNLSQPRHFCKSCKRYWTKGGALRNVPVGGGSRKNAKRASYSAAAKRPPPASSSAPAPPDETLLPLEKVDGPGPGLGQGQFGNFEGSLLPVTRGDDFGQGQFGSFLGMSGSFSSLLVGSSSGAQFGGLLDGLGPNGPHLRAGDHFGDMGLSQNVDTQSDGFLNIDGSRGGDGGCWGGSGGGDWPDLAI